MAAVLTAEQEREVRESFPNYICYAFEHLAIKEPDRWGPPTPLQLDAAEFIQNCGDRGALFCFREFGKTTLLRLYPTWVHRQDINARISIVSAGDDFSGRILSATRKLIDEFDYLRDLAPQWGQKDGAKGYNIAGSVSNPNLSMAAFTVLGNIPGNRPDILIFDDIESLANSDTVKKRAILVSRAGSLEHIIETKGGKGLCAGTPQVQESYYFKYLPRMGYRIRIIPQRYPTEGLLNKVIYKEGDSSLVYGDCLPPMMLRAMDKDKELMRGGGVEGKWGRPVDPRFNEYQCRKSEKKCLTEQEYRLHYLLDTSMVDAERHPLKPKNLLLMSLDSRVGPESVIWRDDPELVVDIDNICNDGDLYYRPAQIGPLMPYRDKVMTIDPSETADGDETAYSIVAELGDTFFLLDNDGLPGGYESDTLWHIAKKAVEFSVPRILVEEAKGQGAWAELLRAKVREACEIADRLFPHIHKEPWRCSVGMLSREGCATMKERRIAETIGPVQGDHRLVINKMIFEREYNERHKIQKRAPERFLLAYQYANLTIEKGSLSKDDRLESLEMGIRANRHVLAADRARAAEQRKLQEMENYVESFKRYRASIVGEKAEPSHKLAIQYCYPFSENN